MKHFRFPKEWFLCVAIGGGQLKTADDWLKYADDQMRGDRSRSQITMKIETPEWQRELKMQADVEGSSKALIIIDSPAKEKGVGTLRMDNSMWNYFPKLKRKVSVSPSMLLSSWMGSDFTNDDILKASSMSADYDHKFLADEKYETETFKVIENIAKSDAKAMWPKIITLSSKKDCLPRYHRYYSKTGELMRTLALSEIKTWDGHKVPSVLVMKPAGGSRKQTTIVYEDIKFNVKFGNSQFSMQKLTDR